MPTLDEIKQYHSAVTYTCRGALPAEARAEINMLLNEGTDTSLQKAVLMDNQARKRCGQVLNEVLLSGPLDGQDHEGICPKCGKTFGYTAAKLDE